MELAYKHKDKTSGDGLSITEWNDLSNAVAGHSGLTLALNPNDKIGIGNDKPKGTLDVARGKATGGTAVFGGTERRSHFNHSTDEHTYIRGGKKDSNVFINDNGGRVSIGTANPASTLDVARGTANGGTALFRGTVRNSYFNHSKDEHTFINGGKKESNVIINDGDGKVGIGLTNPSQKLEVHGNVKATKLIGNSLQIQETVTAKKFIGDGSQLTNLSVGATGLILATEEDAKVGIGTKSPKGTLDVARGTATAGTAVFGGTERRSHFNYSTDEHTYIRGGKKDSNVFINDNGGNVGIGTDKPTAKLHVHGECNITGSIQTNGKPPIEFIRYHNANRKNTRYKSDLYDAAIVGFQSGEGDIKEKGVGNIIQVYMYIQDNEWHLKADFHSQDDHETWTVDVMFVRKELSSREGY